MSTILIEAEIDGMRGREVRLYEVRTGRFVETFSTSASGQVSWTPEEKVERLGSNSAIGDRIHTWMVTGVEKDSPNVFVGCFADRAEFVHFIEHYMRGTILAEVAP